MNPVLGQQDDGPLAVLVVSGGVLSNQDGYPSATRTVRLAGSLHPGMTALASTVSTGVWPENHGVVNHRQPHVDRLGYEIARPERATRQSVWSAAAVSGRHVAVCNWPHGLLEPDLEPNLEPNLELRGRLDRIDSRAIEGLAAEAPGVCPPGTVQPESMQSRLRSLQGSTSMELGCAAIELMADQGPDLMLGWMPSVPGEIDERRARLELLRRRLGEAAGREATLLVLEHGVTKPSVFQQSLRSLPPRLHVLGPREFSITGRPRVDVIPSLVATAMGIDPAAVRYRVDSPVGGQERLEAAGLPNPNRISAFDLKQFEFERNREIGASLVARGRWTEAHPWLSASIQTQHGRVDAACLILILIRIRRARGEEEAARLLASVQQRLPGSLHGLIVAWLGGRTDEVIGEEGRAILKNLGPFLTDAILIDLQRRGLLKRSGSSASED